MTESTSGLNQARYLSLILVDWLGTCMWDTNCLLSWILGYSRKNPKKGVDWWYIYIYVSEKNLGIYMFLTLPLENRLSPLEIPKLWATPLGNSKIKHSRPMENPHGFFLITPRKSTSFLIDSGISACFFQYPLKFHFLNSPYLVFSGIGW